MPQLSVKTVADAATSFYRKLVIADTYAPTTKFQGKAVLIKALQNKANGAIGEDYSLSQVKIYFLKKLLEKTAKIYTIFSNNSTESIFIFLCTGLFKYGENYWS